MKQTVIATFLYLGTNTFLRTLMSLKYFKVILTRLGNRSAGALTENAKPVVCNVIAIDTSGKTWDVSAKSFALSPMLTHIYYSSVQSTSLVDLTNRQKATQQSPLCESSLGI